MNCYTGRQINWRQPGSRTPPAWLGDKWLAKRGDKWIGAGHHQPDWERNELLYGETNEFETAKEPDTTSQTGRQMNCYTGRQMNSRQPESRTPQPGQSRTPPARLAGRQMNCFEGRQMIWRHTESRTPPGRLGEKWIALRGDKWIGDIPRAGHHQPDWERNELLYGETNEFETAKEPDTTSQTGRQMNCYTGRQMNSRPPESRTPQPGQSRTPPARLAGRQMSCFKGRQMNWRHTESRTPPGRLGEKWIAIWGDKWIRDSQRAGHHQPNWERNELLYGETNEFETAKEPDTTSQTERQMNCFKGRQMNWRHTESRTPPGRLGEKWISQRAGHHQPNWETNELL